MESFSVNRIVIFGSCLVSFGTVGTKFNTLNSNSIQFHWFVGRVPPSMFEYPNLNGFYSPKDAKSLCERDLQCGGFTYKGARNEASFVPEIYFFHYINESANYLTTEVKYSHWTTYVVGSRDYVAICGKYNFEGGRQRGTIFEG